MLTVEDIRQAYTRLHELVRRTPLLESQRLNQRFNARILFKAECLQLTGSFKIRGATNRMALLTDEQRKNGVVAYSSGNHAQGVAAAAQLMGIKATIVMPHDAPAIKLRNTREYGAEVVLYSRLKEDRVKIAHDLATRIGATVIPPFDDLSVISGQGTIGIELIQQLEDLDAMADVVLCPTGGGGLIAGISTVLKSLSKSTRIYAVEPHDYNDMQRSLLAGKRLGIDPRQTSICDSILTEMPGELTFTINQKTLSGGLTVSDNTVTQAMAEAFTELKLIVEPGGVVGLAALLAGEIDVNDQTVVIILSGGNVDYSTFCELVQRYQFLD